MLVIFISQLNKHAPGLFYLQLPNLGRKSLRSSRPTSQVADTTDDSILETLSTYGHKKEKFKDDHTFVTQIMLWDPAAMNLGTNKQRLVMGWGKSIFNVQSDTLVLCHSFDS